MLAGSDWLETDEGYLHGHDETEEVERDIGYVDPGGEMIQGKSERKRERERGEGGGEIERLEREYG